MSADLSLFVPLLVCILAAGIASVVPQARTSYGFLCLSLLATVAVYRRALPGYLLTVAAIYIFVSILARLTDEVAHRRLRWRWCCAAMILLVGAFLAGRYYQLEERSVPVLGMQIFYYSLNMWLFLRLTTLLWEFGSGRIDSLGILPYLAWVALPFTLIGPVLRYSQFSPPATTGHTITAPTTDHHGASAPSGPMWLRLVGATLQFTSGIFLGGLLVTLTNSNGGMPRWEKVAISFSIAPWSFYLLWAGYFKYMEVLARSWGIELPPSFNWPFGRRNLSEFWANWNMTATSVIRDYFFYNRWGLAKVNLYLNALIVFLMVGVWHGLNGYWVLWGLLHGVGFCAFLWYKAHKTRLQLWPSGSSWAMTVAGRVVTYLYVCSCWFLPPAILKLFR